MRRRPLVAVLVFDGVVTLDAVGPFEVFRLARTPEGDTAFDTVMVGPEAGPVQTESGLTLVAERALRDVRPHTLVVPGSHMGASAPCLRPDVLDAVRVGAAGTRRIVSICTGAFVLAELGMLDGRNATTHWSRVPDLAETYPQVQVLADAIFVGEDPIWTSAGVTAGIDLALALVEADVGHAAALAIARELVVFMRRPGGQSQVSRYLSDPLGTDDRIARLQTWMADRLHEPLGVERLASEVAMSPRNFRRLVRRVLDTTPGRWVERCRVDAVLSAFESSNDTLEVLAQRFGLGTAERLRRAFVRCVGVPPSEARARFR